MIREFFFACCAALVTTGPVLAAHPLVTDDTGTQGKGKFQMEVSGEYARDKSSEGGVTTKETAGEVGFIFSYGVADSTDVVLGMPYQRFQVKEDGLTTAREAGLSDMTVEVKHRFYEKNGLSFAIKPAVSLPAGDEEKGLGTGEPGYGVTFIATKEAGHWAFHFNAGYTRSEYKLQADEDANRNDIWHVSLASEYGATEDLTLVANAGVERNEDKTSSSHPAFALGGLVYSVTGHIDLNCGVKAGLNEAEADVTFLAGLALKL